MKNINTALIVIFIFIVLACSAGVVQAQNYTVIMSYGQTPYQLGYLSNGNVTGWTWWDTDGGMQQKNLILVSIMENTTTISGLSPPAWIQDSSVSYGPGNSWRAGEGIHSWHYLDDFNTPGTPLEDIILPLSLKTPGFFTQISNWLQGLITGVNPAATSTINNMTFWTTYNITDDNGYVLVSADRGATWDTLEEISGNSSGWVEKTVNLSAYNGQAILVAFYLSSNDNNIEDWWIDDIEVRSNGALILGDYANTLPPELTVDVTYPNYDYVTHIYSNKTTSINLVEDYTHQIYYGVFVYPDDAYTGKYLMDFSTTINFQNLIASNSFNTTLWGCQARGCHDSWSPVSDSSIRNPTIMIHPDNITSDLSGNCLTMCHSTYSSQFLRATPVHLHEIEYGHEGGFIYGPSGWTTIYNSSNAKVDMYYKTNVKRPLSQTSFTDLSHVTQAECIDCHTNFIHDTTGSDIYQIANPNSLLGTIISSTGVHATNVTCENCHGNLSYPSIPAQFSINDNIGYFNPEFMSYESVTKTYVVDMDGPGINVTVIGTNEDYRFYLSLIGPIDDTVNGLQDLNTNDHWDGTYIVPSVNGTAIFASGSKIYYPSGDELHGVTFDASPRSGKWIARVFPRSPGTFNYTITSNRPIQEKPVIHIPWNCSECHNPNATGALVGAITPKPIPSWDNNGLSFTHTDINNDSKDDITCRSCHNSMHDISIRDCTDCHIQRPGGHTMANFFTMGYNGCMFCHWDPHYEPENAAGGNCTACHLDDGSSVVTGLPMISKDGFFNSSHKNITGDFDALNYTAVSMVCWGCHVNYTEQLLDQMHTRPVSELPVCEDCHFNETPLNGIHLRKIPPIQIPEHQPMGEDIQTNISTGCTLCHNNSLSIPIPIANVLYAEAKNYVSHYLNTTNLMTPDNRTLDCMWCHVDNSNNISWGRPTDPLTSTKLNHTPFNLINSTDCYPCHISNEVKVGGIPLAGFTFHNQSMAPGAGKDCVICHDIDGMVSEQFQIDVQAMNRSGAIHYDLNRGAAVTADPNSARCWACHGDGNGTEAAQPTGHPVNYTTPRNCVDQACHNFNQSIFNEPMVYEHIKHVIDADKHVNTTVNCQDCHKNSVMNNVDTFIPNDTSLVSHYGSTYNLVNTSDCIYCHYDEDNAEEWGNAPDPRNHTHYGHVEKTLVTGEPWYLMDNYVIRLIETTEDTAVIHLEKYGSRLDRKFVSEGEYLEFEISGIETDETTFVKLLVTNIFSAEGNYAVELSGDVLASRLHKETENNQCYECHDREYRANLPDGRDYIILDKDDENVTLGLMLQNFKEDDEKSLRMGEYWYLGEGYKLYVADVSIKGTSAARLKLYRNETLVQDSTINEGSIFTYKDWVLDREIVVFSAKLDLVFVGITTAPPVVIIKDVRLIGSEQKILDADLWALQTKTLLGSLPLDSIITVGNEPETFHVYTISPGGYSSDCISCHAGNGVAPIKIDLDTFKMGVHVDLNQNAYYNSFISDEANKACWACHANGSEPTEHPTPYLGKFTPKTCRYCHEHSRFDATQIFTHFQGSEISTSSTCNDCHSNAIPENILTDDQAATSHYSTRDDLLNTSHCDYCHNNETNAPVWGNAPQVTKHIANNNCTLCHAGEGITTFHGEGITITRTCEDCHVDKQQAEKYDIDAIITHYPGASDDNANTLKNNEYTCRVCHNSTNNSLHTNLEVREYQNETMGFCFQCHSEYGEFPYKSQSLIGDLRHGSGIKVVSGCDTCHAPEGISRFHTPTLLGKGTFRGAVRHDVDCMDCHLDHEGQEYQPYEGIQCVDCHSEYGSVHFAGAEVQMANQTNTCKLCHNDEADIYHELTRFVSNVSDEVYESCRDCHTDIDTLKDHVRSASIAGGTMATISHPTSESTITCSSCHNSTGENRFHFDSYPLGTVQNPEWQNWTAGNITGCKDCHTYQGGKLPFNATNMGTQGTSPSGTAHGLAPNCTLCHGGNDPISLHYLATSKFIPRLAVTLDPEEVYQGEKSFLQVAVVLPALTKITRAEYFIDDFSGEGFGNPLEYVVGGATDSSVLLGALIDTSELSIGKHLIFVHVKDSSGKWSNVEINTLNVKNPVGIAIIETMFKDIIPIAIFAIILYFIWRRLR